jgi:hypothetical protein
MRRHYRPDKDRRVIRHNHAFGTVDAANTTDHPSRRDIVRINAMRGKGGKFQKRRSGIDQIFDTITWQHFATRQMFGAGVFIAALFNLGQFLAKIGDQLFNRRRILLKIIRLYRNF